MRPEQDAFGHLLLDHLEGRPAQELVERSDGFIGAGAGPGSYFAPYRQWPSVERRALRLARGRVLDVGCGAGRVALRLEERGREVVGIDVSPLAVEVCRRRGARDVRVLPLARVGPELGVFDTVVMFGNNFGLFGSPAGARRLLKRLGHLTAPRARVLAESVDPYETDDPGHLAYHEANRARGRAAGQLRLRVRHRGLATPWFDYLLVSPGEMDKLAADAGWRLVRVIEGDGPLYVGVLEKD